MVKDYPIIHERNILRITSRRPPELVMWLGLFSVLTSLFLFSSPQISFAQSSSSVETPASLEMQGANSQLPELEAARDQYLSIWNNTAFNSRFDVFIAEGSDSGYGIYREHTPANVFRPGETMVLYMEPVGFGHQPIADTSNQEGVNGTIPSRTLYLINMTVDIIIHDASGSPADALENLGGASFISHRQNTEFPLVVTLSQEEPFPAGDYIITYIVHDQVTGQSFEIDRQITIDENAVTGALPLPGVNNDNSVQELPPQQSEEPTQALEPGSLQNNTQ